MKKYALVVTLGLGMAAAGYALAGTGTTQLTTYYPAPASNYQMVKLSTATYSTPSGTYTSGPNTCTPVGATCVCNSGNPGMLFADGSGTIYICKQNGNQYYASIYPQQCYNYFCTGSTGPMTCSSDCDAQGSSCVPKSANLPAGFQYLTASGATSANENQAMTDSFPSTATTNVYSTVLCSY